VLLEHGAFGVLLHRIQGDLRAILMETCALVFLQHNIVLKEIIGPTTLCVEGDYWTNINPPCWTNNPLC
jgi:hypothetical protein